MQAPLYLIAGLGKTGFSMARYLQRHNQPFVVFDTRPHPVTMSAFKLEFPHVEVFLGTIPTTLFSKLTAIMTSPGVPLDEPCLQQAQALGVPILGDIECLAREVQAPVIAITGTNGKSTVTTLVGEMARAAGMKVAVAGNIGLPVLDLLDDDTAYDLWVLELSSFQLELTHSLAPIAATILNVTPDHLDRHHTLNAYVNAKQHIYQQAKLKLYNRDDALTVPAITSSSDNTISYGLDTPTAMNWGIRFVDDKAYLAQGSTCLLPVDTLRIKGRHNWANALAACALAEAAGIPIATIITVLQQFAGLPHRTQWVRAMNGVDWINDSKGTNIGATVSAIAGIGGSMQGKIVLIAGGQGKGADFNALRQSMTEYVRSVVLIGEDAPLIETALRGVVDVVKAASLEEAAHLAKSKAQAGDVVLLSPACASFDMFRDFNHRGEAFTAVVESL